MRFPLWRDPSQAMKDWMDADDRWHDDQDYITMGGGDLIDATSFADSEARRRYGQVPFQHRQPE